MKEWYNMQHQRNPIQIQLNNREGFILSLFLFTVFIRDFLLPPPTSPLLSLSTASSGYFGNNDDKNLINMNLINLISPPERKSLFKHKLQELVLETFSTRLTTTTILPLPSMATLMTAHCITAADGKEVHPHRLTRKFLNLRSKSYHHYHHRKPSTKPKGRKREKENW
jgi:hypothetical protein